MDSMTREAIKFLEKANKADLKNLSASDLCQINASIGIGYALVAVALILDKPNQAIDRQNEVLANVVERMDNLRDFVKSKIGEETE